MDWHVKPMAKHCAATQMDFEVGERVHCLLFASDPTGELARADVKETALPEFQPDGTILGRWTREIRSETDEAKEARKMAEHSAEMLFFSLYEEPKEGADGAVPKLQRDTLRHLLALLLERRRILRPVGPRVRTGEQTYLHIREKREFAVPLASLDVESVTAIRSLIGEIVG